MADDDEDDRQLTREALGEAKVDHDLRCVVDGEDLMDYLHRRGAYEGEADAPTPSMILLDLNMPRKDGHEALAEIKSDAVLRRIPVVVLTTSRVEPDVITSYDLGANSFITKPRSFTELVDVVRDFSRYWFDIAELPGPAAA
jgi:CheY-like chemotaxis protein